MGTGALIHKKLPKQKFILLQIFIVVALFTVDSCNPQIRPVTQNKDVKKEQATGITRKNIFAAPIVHQITAVNLPKVVKVGKPVIRIEAPKGGTPLFTNYGTEQGLALSGVFYCFTDKTGNVWFGTRGGGVSKYDGKRFTNYTTAQGLPSNSIYRSMQDKDGNIWFGTDDASVTAKGRRESAFKPSSGAG